MNKYLNQIIFDLKKQKGKRLSLAQSDCCIFIEMYYRNDKTDISSLSRKELLSEKISKRDADSFLLSCSRLLLNPAIPYVTKVYILGGFSKKNSPFVTENIIKFYWANHSLLTLHIIYQMLRAFETFFSDYPADSRPIKDLYLRICSVLEHVEDASGSVHKCTKAYLKTYKMGLRGKGRSLG
jgi:hypothetical protein